MADPDFRHPPALQGERVRLRRYLPQDLPAIREALRDPEINRLTGSVHFSGPVLEMDADRLHDWYASRADQQDRLDLMVADLATDAWVGEVVLNEWEPGNRSCNFRILMGPHGQNRGYGTEATRLLLDHAFTGLGLHRVSLEVYAFNPRAQHVYTKVGFVVEGRRREALQYDGQWVDAIVMAVLEHEWQTD